MGIEISAPVAGIGGGAMVVGGSALAVRARSQLLAATSMSNFSTPSLVAPTVNELRTTLEATGTMLDGVQSAMAGARLPGTGLFRRIPFIGGAADDLERAARLGAAARELSKVDETALVASAARLNEHAGRLAAAVEGDAARIGVAKVGVLSATNRLLLGGGIAAAGAILLAASIFDVGGD